METTEIENDYWYSIKMEQDGETYYLDQVGLRYDTPSWSKTAIGTIADCKEVFNALKGIMPKDAEYSIVKVEEIFRVSYALNLQM